MTDISKEDVEVLARIIGGRSPNNTEHDQTRAANTLIALQARVEELEALLPWLSEWTVYPPNGVGLSQWEIAHKDYDGAPDANDSRYFHGNSKLSVLQQAADFVAEEGGQV